MTNAKHTPGPWVADVSDTSDVVVWAGVDGEFICNIGHQVQRVDVAFDVDVHNAHIIAAGPEMLEALLQIESCAYTMASLDDVTASMVISAIAKATGEVK